ncbi:hypothetical protein, partial [Massilia sp. TSP1-1-2]|uniref:hypothetical protein n=1 Tax=Massilia sp. TSP1-1-2 TaxID=2804649 RepID=UPI003CF418AF
TVWEFEAREVHDKRCGGDPGVAPLRETYKISSAGQVWAYDVVNDSYKPLDAVPTNKHASATEKISEKQALNLLMSELKARKIESLDCLFFMSGGNPPAESKATVWEFEAREVHDKRCGGDPGVAPLRDTYKISSAGQVWAYDVVNDSYKPL